jgi:hypothetical protein
VDPLQALQSYFSTGAAESEIDLLANAFVAPAQMVELLGAPSGSLRILVGHKGIGKTALLEHLRMMTKKSSIPALLLRPDDLDVPTLQGISDLATIKKRMFESVVAAVAAHVGNTLSGLLADDAARLYQTAVAVKRRRADWMSQVLTFLSAAAKPLIQVDGRQLAADLAGPDSPQTLVSSLQSHLRMTGSAFFVLLDDTDQVASPDDPQHLNRIWGLLLALRRLATECSSLRCIASLRAEVWTRLQRDEKGQRDQVDHLRPLVVDLRASPELLDGILDRRMSLAARLVAPDVRNPYTVFFEGEHVRLPTSEETRSWKAFLVKSSRDRPRDMVLLVDLLAKTAKANRRSIITSADAENAMVTYSRDRADDCAIEFARDCPQLRDILRSFADLDAFTIGFEDVREHLKGVPSRFGITLRGRTLQPDTDDSALALLALLHETGFLNARVADTRQSRGFRHINFQDDAGFVQRTRWNELQGARWEVHPAFRDYLHSARTDKRSAQGPITPGPPPSRKTH